MPSPHVPQPTPEPDERPRRRRRTARVLILDPGGSVFLWHDSDPWAEGKPTFWITAGGGVDHGESDVSAAVREVHEELGLIVQASELVGPLAERTVVHGYSDVVQLQEEVFFAIRVDGIEPDTAGHTPDEQVTFQGFRWWTADELDTAPDLVFPSGLAELVRTADRALRDGRGHPLVPLALSAAEESTVLAGEAADPEGSTIAATAEVVGDADTHLRGQHSAAPMTSADWDRRYREEPGLWGTDVTVAARPVLAALAAGQGAGRRAVDLASGSGRHALWLAAHGWQVTAVDFSRAAVERGREQGAAAGVSVDWRVADALDWAPDTPVQLVLVAFFQLPADQLRQVLRRAATWLTPDGSLLYVGHAMDNLAHGTGGPPRPEVLATVGDLAGVGEGYEIRALGHVRRPVPEHRDAIDIVLWLSPWPAADDTGP